MHGWVLGGRTVRCAHAVRKVVQGTEGTKADLHCDTMVQICGAVLPRGNRHFVTAPPPPPPPDKRGEISRRGGTVPWVCVPSVPGSASMPTSLWDMHGAHGNCTEGGPPQDSTSLHTIHVHASVSRPSCAVAATKGCEWNGCDGDAYPRRMPFQYVGLQQPCNVNAHHSMAPTTALAGPFGRRLGRLWALARQISVALPSDTIMTVADFREVGLKPSKRCSQCPSN